MSELDNHLIVSDVSDVFAVRTYRAMFTDPEEEKAVIGVWDPRPLLAYGNTRDEAIDRLVEMTFMIAGV